MANRKKFTLHRRKKLCEYIIKFGGNITQSLKAIDVSATVLYDYKRKGKADIENNQPETPEAKFLLAFQQAEKLGLYALEDEARRRAFEGVTRDIYYQGEVVGQEILYSDKLIAFLLQGGNRKKYGSKYELSGLDGAPIKTDNITTKMTTKEAADLYKQTLKNGQ